MCRPVVPVPHSSEVAVSYWYNVSTGQVETDENRSRGVDVMGPYSSEAEAAKALDSARARTDKWDDEDREWESKGSSGHGDEDLED